MIVEKTLRTSIEEDVPILVLQNMFNMEQNTQTNLRNIFKTLKESSAPSNVCENLIIK